ncbi:glycine betaine/L-proline ABC transporter ATP-binding protein ProV [Piscinibacter sakaiensis]|uniref:glycine betaine/L-proline ABC transporter ATP-binding protein ProV n=1 Tax=Piscinibacter sakaiensis TaxID=1547922 RepID=UPI003AAD1FC3
MSDRLIVKNLYKVFGSKPDEAMRLVREGLDKDAIFERTGQTIGVNDASFTVQEGEIFVVMGLSGSGKSTLVRLLNRLIEPTAGHVLFDGADIAAMSAKELRELRRRHISMVFQSFALMPHLTVLQNAGFGLELAGEPTREREASAMAALEQVGLAAWARSYPDELSGGMQQRVGLARALANNPSVLLMDEAFSALDPLIRTEMQDELVKLQRKDRRTIIFISHDLDEAIRIGDRIAIMEGGNVVQVGTPEDIIKNPATPYVRSFFKNVDVTNVFSAADLARKSQVSIIDHQGMGVRSALQRLRQHQREFGYVVSPEQAFMGVVSIDTLQAELQGNVDPKLRNAFIGGVEPITVDTPITNLYGPLAAHPHGLPVVDDAGRYRGSITKNTLLEFLEQRSAA